MNPENLQYEGTIYSAPIRIKQILFDQMDLLDFLIATRSDGSEVRVTVWS